MPFESSSGSKINKTLVFYDEAFLSLLILIRNDTEIKSADEMAKNPASEDSDGISVNKELNSIAKIIFGLKALICGCIERKAQSKWENLAFKASSNGIVKKHLTFGIIFSRV